MSLPAGRNFNGLRSEALVIRAEVGDLRRLPRRSEGAELGAA
jgi:hypothetical protein